MLALLDPTSLVQSAGYAAIFLLSIAQSCCVPTSSELTLGFAGVLAAEGKLSLPGAIVAGVAGEIIGAYIAWFIGRAGGRRFVDRFGRYILLSHHDLDRAEGWYRRHPRFGVFGSRLLPVIRNFVAVPAGVAEVPLLRFGVLTALGSLLWDSAMALIGYGVGSNYKSVMHGFSDAGYVLGVLVVAAVAFVIYHRYRSTRQPPTAVAPGGRAGTPAHRRGVTAAGVSARGSPPAAVAATPPCGGRPAVLPGGAPCRRLRWAGNRGDRWIPPTRPSTRWHRRPCGGTPGRAAEGRRRRSLPLSPRRPP